MKFYFSLQYRLIYRQIAAIGLNPFAGLVVLSLLFVVLSLSLFVKTSLAPYIYIGAVIHILSDLGNAQRNNFLKQIYSRKTFIQIRMIENTIITLPFILFLCYKNYFYFAGITFLISLVLSFTSPQKRYQFAVPTPFYHYPFEFVVGFRRFWWLIIGFYILAIIGINVNNFNLSIVVFGFQYLLMMLFYMEVEPAFYIWIYKANATRFLYQKIKIAILYSTIVYFASYIITIFYLPQYIYIVIGLHLLGICFLILALLGKYATIGTNNALLPSMAIGFCLIFPPMMLFFIPFFFHKAQKELNRVLN